MPRSHKALIAAAVFVLVLALPAFVHASFQLDYAPEVLEYDGISAPQRALGQEGYPLLRGTVRVERPTQARREAPGASGDVWGRLRNCESSNGRSSPNGLYHGYFQFDQSTWNSVGGSGHPGAASYDEQLKRAKMLQASRGWGPWPSCSRQLGLR